MPAPQLMGLYPADSIQVSSVEEVAQSLSLDPVSMTAAELLAGDVEHRLHLILQEAKKFMIHGKRATLTPEDVEHAMDALGVEPILVPSRSLPSQPFTPLSIPVTNMSTQQIYHVPDDEIDFATYLQKPLPAGLQNSAGVKWKAHWLAVEGVQPAIPENPAPNARAGSSRQPPVPQTGHSSLRPSAKSHLPQELQLYFTRLTSALVPSVSALPVIPPPESPDGVVPEAERLRQAALTSVGADQAMAGILVYFVKWLAESVQRCLVSTVGTLWCLTDAVEAVLANQSIFIEPYLHQILPPLLSVVLAVPLGPAPGSPPPPGHVPTPYDVRARAAEILGKIASTYGPSYPTLVPRLTSTFKSALHSSPSSSPLGPSSPPAGRYEGAILGLTALGQHVVKDSIWGNAGEGLRYIDGLVATLYPDTKRTKIFLIKAVLRSLNLLSRPKPIDASLVPAPPSQQVLSEVFGPNIAASLGKRPWQASELLNLRTADLERAKSGEAGNEGMGGATATATGTGADGEGGGEKKDEVME